MSNVNVNNVWDNLTEMTTCIHKIMRKKYAGDLSIFLENDFRTPPLPINYVYGSYRKCLNLN